MQEALWNKLEQESSLWYSRFLLYRNIKPLERSYLKAYNLYQEQVGKSRKKPYEDIPGSWRDAIDTYQWKERAEAYDAHIHAEAEQRQRVLFELEQAEIERILTEGYAAVHERVKALDTMARTIESAFYKEEEAGKYVLVPQWLDAKKIEQWRGCLDDIAKELQHRVKKQETTLDGSVAFTTGWGGGVAEEETEA